jgi:hypothetical protein
MEFLSSNAPHALIRTLLFTVAVSVQLGIAMFGVNDAFIPSIAWNASMPTSTRCFGESSSKKSKTRVLWLLSSRHVKWQNVDVLSNVRQQLPPSNELDWLVLRARGTETKGHAKKGQEEK